MGVSEVRGRLFVVGVPILRAFLLLGYSGGVPYLIPMSIIEDPKENSLRFAHGSKASGGSTTKSLDPFFSSGDACRNKEVRIPKRVHPVCEESPGGF